MRSLNVIANAPLDSAGFFSLAQVIIISYLEHSWPHCWTEIDLSDPRSHQGRIKTAKAAATLNNARFFFTLCI